MCDYDKEKLIFKKRRLGNYKYADFGYPMGPSINYVTLLWKILTPSRFYGLLTSIKNCDNRLKEELGFEN